MSVVSSLVRAVTIERRGVRYEDGSASCLVPGARIEVEGSYDGTTMQAMVIEFEDDSCRYNSY